VTTGFSRSHKPFYAISPEKCRYVTDRSCSLCITACEAGAIDLDREATAWTATADAVVLATGFAPFSPEVKPYGYGVFDNVITHLGMEQVLRDHAAALRPSDGRQAGRIAFIQCVGSRDAKLGHLWCSRVCCGSALRMAGLVLADAPETAITFYYMDVQTFGRGFDADYAAIRDQVRMIRSIPGDIYPAENDTLRVTFLDAATSETRQEDFDLVVLSVAMVPVSGLKDTCRMLDVKLADTGFAAISDTETTDGASGVFTAGAVTGPMSIAESIASGRKTAWDIAKSLGLAP
jgi:heterodisulfide reductase subunit A